MAAPTSRIVSMNNPYAWSVVDPDLCYGRSPLLTDLLSGLAENPRYSYGLAGGRRMGKTTVLRRVERDLQERVERWRDSGLLVIPVYVDGLTLPRPLTEDDIWETLLRRIRSSCHDNLRNIAQIDFEVFKEEMSKIVDMLEEQLRIIVMFDEIELILACDWANAFLSHWRALLNNTPGLSECFTAVFAGARELNVLRHDIGSPLKDILEWRSLRSLAYEDACRLMQQPINRQWDSSFLNCVYRETGGHPMLLQYVMQDICQLWPEERDRLSMDQLVERASAKFMHERRWQFAEWWNRYCSLAAQRVYTRLYGAGGEMTLRDMVHEFGSEDANDAVEILQHVGLVEEIEESDQGLSYRCVGDMFRRWYARYGTLSGAPRHDLELYNRLVALDEDMGAKYLSAWRIYQQDIPNYSGAVGELRDTLTLLLDIIAPIKNVQSEPGFQHEPSQESPTRRQRVRYAARTHYSRDRVKEIASDYDLVETLSEQLSMVVTMSYRRSSGQTHTTATREQAYQALKQWESIFAQLIPFSENTPIGTRE